VCRGNNSPGLALALEWGLHDMSIDESITMGLRGDWDAFAGLDDVRVLRD